ncbi:hypothetical protein UFOVP1495_27 [uncultured Caudovirales phage]|uniref:Uncharacterized protein n=3 Tax=uncultured Caudovirales phage TaxID=2100421 RepID=A0A6J5SQ74_9CAUD|nr:hypothetical protein UFOVP1495_27 [uncultured Caudovirales phage]
MISIAAEFVGKKSFSQAENATEKLTKNVKNLAKAFGVGFGTAAVVNFAKASVKAFAEDENASRSLAVTLKNLGLETGNTSIYINDLMSRMEKQTGVIDDELRPAMDRLLRATGSITKSQDLLNLALDIAAGTGKSVTQVSQSLQKAYLGQTQALGRLGVGLSKAELTSSSFEDIQKKLTLLFKGQAKTAADGYAGSIAKLSIATNNAKEAIGKGLVDALLILSKDHTIDDLTSSMEKFATATGDALRGVALFADQFKVDSKGENIFSAIAKTLGDVISYGPLGGLINKGAQSRRAAEVAKGKNPIQSGTYLNNPVVKNTTAIEKLTAVQLAQLKIAKAAAMFDLKKIGIAAALKGNISPDAKNRLLAMQAIENGNADLAAKYSSKINPNASMNVNVHVAGSVTSATDLVSTVRKGLLDANVAGQQTNIRRTGTTAMRAI